MAELFLSCWTRSEEKVCSGMSFVIVKSFKTSDDRIWRHKVLELREEKWLNYPIAPAELPWVI